MTVLVAYNESPQGEAAMRAAVTEATRREQELAVLVLTPQVGPKVPAALAHLLDTVPGSVTVAPIVFRPEHADVADAIVDQAEAVSADLVVIGSRKHSSVGKFLVGSTTQRVLLDSPAPVLVVKAGYA
ncbi:universal stress protein [Promicromonospora iranensis]|uniref:Nucleotide-binding universal stress UspA family protein n=1 Tax=Promicromonospora iranensis TaxID=1105144 RepID=A0ABU2CM45_9MICO|nr:universal stress protein [Promicromonospora iranensis]MDR7382247.1 nucleotide-binding universal stress UspA family protein [Promicromonospora iranensis]